MTGSGGSQTGETSANSHAQYGPSATLARILERLGSTLLSLQAGQPDSHQIVTSVVMHDALDPPVISPGTFVLGAGLSDVQDIAAAVRSFAQDGAVALVLREPVLRTPAIDAALVETSLSLYGLIRGASWIQVATLVTSALSTISPDELMVGAHDSGTDLFELANSLSALLDAPVTFENLSSRVIAFSSDQSAADEGRHRTILNMRVPADVGDLQRQHGLFRKVYESERPVYVSEFIDNAMPRVAMRVRAGEEVLGSIWAIVKEPLTMQRELGMVEAAQVVALTMLRARLGSDAATRLRLGLVMKLLDGGANAREAARQLSFAGQPVCVVAMAGVSANEEDAAAIEADQQRTVNALSMYLKPIQPRSIAALIGSVLYAVIPLKSAEAGAHREATRIAREFITRLDPSQRYFAGVGTAVADAAELAISRTAADAALRAVRHHGQRRVAALDDVQVEDIMLRVGDILSADHIAISGPLKTLRVYDAKHDGFMEDTLRAWLDAFGDVAKASVRLRIHSNTFRYRINRLQEVAGIDLTDPDVRFALSLQLRVFE